MQRDLSIAARLPALNNATIPIALVCMVHDRGEATYRTHVTRSDIGFQLPEGTTHLCAAIDVSSKHLVTWTVMAFTPEGRQHVCDHGSFQAQSPIADGGELLKAIFRQKLRVPSPKASEAADQATSGDSR
ncbi:MAG: hypothetical protein LLG00_11660 [Planctomycetaceae bacterium]|nr:hypothetical protein [Planctomycetaceae bacterium]